MYDGPMASVQIDPYSSPVKGPNLLSARQLLEQIMSQCNMLDEQIEILDSRTSAYQYNGNTFPALSIPAEAKASEPPVTTPAGSTLLEINGRLSRILERLNGIATRIDND